MATRQQKRDEFARSLGYKNYTDYRNAKAREMGYSGYSEQRRARRTGTGLKGADAALTRQASAAGAAPPLSASPRLNPRVESDRLKAEFRRVQMGLEAAQDAMVQNRTFRRGLTTGLEKELAKLEKNTDDWLKNEITRIYTAGLRRGSGDPNAGMDKEDLAWLDEFRGDDARSLTYLFDDTRDEGKRFMKRMSGIKDKNTRQYVAKKEDIKPAMTSTGARRRLDDYGGQILDSLSSRAYSMGILRGGERTGVKAYRVSDGKGCGWTEHRDPRTADGMIVSVEDAIAHPIAHPHCQRTFDPIFNGPGSGKPKRIAQGVAAAVGVGAATAAGALAVKKGAELLAKHGDLLAGANPFVQFFDHAVARVIGAQRMYFPSVVDLATGRPKVFTVQDVADQVAHDLDEFAAGREVSSMTRQLFGVTEVAERKVVGDAFLNWQDYYNYRFQNSAAGSFSSLLDLAEVLTDTGAEFADFFPDLEGRFARFSLPRVGKPGKKYAAARFQLVDPNKLIRIRSTARMTENGIKGVTGLNLNPNGLIRAGFFHDTETGLIIPRFRLVPKGPIRVSTRINRSGGRLVRGANGEMTRVGKGRVTSATTELRVITKRIPAMNDIRFSMNLNLRALGIDSMSDLRNLTAADFRRMRMDDMKFVSVATDMRLKGFNLADFSKVFRVSRESITELIDNSAFMADFARTIGPENITEAADLSRFLADTTRTMGIREAEKIWHMTTADLKFRYVRLNRLLTRKKEFRPDLRLYPRYEIDSEGIRRFIEGPQDELTIANFDPQQYTWAEWLMTRDPREIIRTTGLPIGTIVRWRANMGDSITRSLKLLSRYIGENPSDDVVRRWWTTSPLKEEGDMPTVRVLGECRGCGAMRGRPHSIYCPFAER